jgi:hypothetical protein
MVADVQITDVWLSQTNVFCLTDQPTRSFYTLVFIKINFMLTTKSLFITITPQSKAFRPSFPLNKLNSKYILVTSRGSP